jgi:hypothetical protein
MIAMLLAQSTIPVLFAGYALLAGAALGGATVLTWDGAQLFLANDRTDRTLHQRRYVRSLARAVACVALVAFAGAVIGVAPACTAAMFV